MPLSRLHGLTARTAANLWIVAFFAFSLWLRAGHPIQALGDAAYDDLLFVRLADFIGSGQWLGPYDHLTMAKGAAYSLFMAINQRTGIPLKLAEQLMYLLASATFVTSIRRVCASNCASVAIFAVLALNPQPWTPDVGGRVVRENLYTSLSLLGLALAIRICVQRPGAAVTRELAASWPLLALLGLVGGLYWLTREEGSWLLPALALLALYWTAANAPRIRESRAQVAAAAAFLAVPLACFSLVVGTVDAVNLAHYGVFRNNDFRSADFQAAYGALSRISHDRWMRYVVFPRDARERAYAVSAAARELRPYFEGPGGEFWRQAGCGQTGITPCPEVLSGWFMWSLRGAVAAAGHYRTAVEAQRFHLQLAREVNDACDRAAIPCGPPRSTLVPPWHEGYLGDTLRASLAVFTTLMSVGYPSVYIPRSIGDPKNLALFARVTNGPLAPPEPGAWDNTPNHRIAKAIARLQRQLTRVALPASIVAWLALVVYSIARRQWHPAHVVCAALVAALSARVVLLGFLEATSIPSNNALYLSPVVPLALAFPFRVALLARSLWPAPSVAPNTNIRDLE